MKLTRRQFLKSALATGAVVALPIGGEWAEAKTPVDISTGVESFGNGWYRCWMTYKNHTLSSFAKQIDTCTSFRLTFQDGYATFDIATGKVTEVGINETYKNEGHTWPEQEVAVAGRDPWGIQLEQGPKACLYVSTTSVNRAKSTTLTGLLKEQSSMNKLVNTAGASSRGSPLGL